ncbi:MAG: type II toxin-antitoxin system VapC family toxin [Planctomycetales bacterium]|nr:type II toxin-antitoxin system VapC family toxin [Planctomycetales bacterium]NIM09542.1 type II toxin-antitoxin system VapC family toxin [Planctomycetales bacterium]NIN09032.1 type II toxin-antitoxin system VapC family toxin [Planctomycetales bacterium]NIN78145.1 type II toxin-antitoxin system VapC family toxin [Planctomycetales bacterium]NIO35330.1 type II toxin-antitoxin system VapC family toxin [Planctomycetales bacterium]
MLVLDTDHLVELDVASPVGLTLAKRLEEAAEETATTIISAEEQFRGWLAQIHRLRDPHQQIVAYQRLGRRIEFFAAWHVLQWDASSADVFQDLRRQRVRVGTMDLKIASIVLVHDATLLSRNLRDFRQIPGLKVDDWL